MDDNNKDFYKKKSRGRIFAVIAAIIIIVAAVGGVLYYLSTVHHVRTQTITVLVGSGSDTEEYLSAVAKNFEKANPNIKIDITTVGYSDIVDTPLTALRDKASSPSIIMYYPSGAPTLGPYLYNLSGRINTGLFPAAEMFSGGYLLNLNGSVEKTIGVPIHNVLGYVLVYQKDVFDNKTLSSEFEKEYNFSFNPDTWTNWTQVLDAATFLKNSNDSSLPKYQLLFPDSPNHSIIDAFMGLLYSYGQGKSETMIPKNSGSAYWTYIGDFNGTWEPTFNNAAGVQALKMYKKLINFEPSLSVEPIGYDEQLKLFETGDYAMGLAWTSFLPAYSKSTVGKDLGVAILPQGATGYQPTFLGVNPYSNTSLDMKFIDFAISNSEFSMGVKDFQFLPSTYSGMEAAESQPGFSWLAPMLNYSEKIVPPVKNVAVYIHLEPLFTELTPDLNGQIYNYFEGKETATAALSTAYSEWMSEIKSENL
ncbi:extracellular solute-binding protein [Picrophilus oshimae]|uniref:Carbohydrate ABC transporter substrate-binding protein, CUT1 family n=1 Tax=Picrophilus torridus (strain ATCC 700027 / DSM 9790 / JCM 10055 / NBRC 100828 / KAW 2/3) TaxID=1122961 RepID=Q6KYX2_PICTO|nr:extracellular solute-binding protein [Picrophilus oshimae]AAT44080.1 sugar ABC transporter extracellular solute binding protein [Picrophilus oshimae DSM 9789]SMD30851.1 carbohydrate ABC transporter substrate-binding protein, CUT1 family [Picrophilus oshimae DSM 9789]